MTRRSGRGDDTEVGQRTEDSAGKDDELRDDRDGDEAVGGNQAGNGQGGGKRNGSKRSGQRRPVEDLEGGPTAVGKKKRSKRIAEDLEVRSTAVDQAGGGGDEAVGGNQAGDGDDQGGGQRNRSKKSGQRRTVEDVEGGSTAISKKRSKRTAEDLEVGSTAASRKKKRRMVEDSEDGSPAASSESWQSRIQFLQSLSTFGPYTNLVNKLAEREVRRTDNLHMLPLDSTRNRSGRLLYRPHPTWVSAVSLGLAGITRIGGYLKPFTIAPSQRTRSVITCRTGRKPALTTNDHWLGSIFTTLSSLPAC